MSIVVLCVCADLLGQRSVANDETDASGELIRLRSPIALQALVDLVVERQGLDVLYDPDQLKGSVSLRLGEPVRRDDLVPLVTDVLASKGFALVRTSNAGVLRVVRLGDAAGLGAVALGGDIGSVGPFGTVVLEVEHGSAKVIADAVKVFLSRPGGAVLALPGDRLLVVSDAQPRLVAVQEMVERMDRPGATPTMRSVPVHHLDPARVVALADEIKSKQIAVGHARSGELVASNERQSVTVVAPASEMAYWERLVAELDQRQPVERRWYDVGTYPIDAAVRLLESIVDGEEGPWDLVPDARTGSIMVRTTPRRHEEVQRVVDHLAIGSGDDGVCIETISLRFRKAADVANVIRSLDPRGETANADGAVDAAAMVVATDERTNSIICSGTTSEIRRLRELAERLDVAQPQVLVEATMVSISDVESLDVGAELQRLEIHGGTFFKLTSLFGLSGSGVAPSDVTRLGGGGAGFTGIVLDPGEFSIVLRALETVSLGRSVRRPRMLINNNQQATFDAVTEQPFVSVNASNTVSTTSFGGFASAGTQVSVRPQITGAHQLVLEYSVAVSTFVGDSPSEGVPPPRQQNNLQSVATVPDGHTIILGGFEEHSEGEAVGKIPIIGEVPLIGALFRNTSRSSSRSRFFVFVTATVMRDERFACLKHASAAERIDAGVESSWPNVEPLVIE